MNNDPYATHLHVLQAIGMLFSPATILELGSGVYSTPLFCNKDIFAGVKRLEVYENNKKWHTDVLKSLPKRRVVNFTLYENSIVDELRSLDLNEFQLIFIDNGVSLEERAATIKEIAMQKLEEPLIVIHDFEHVAYQWAADQWEHLLVHVKRYPQTAVLWNGDRLTAQQSTMLQQAALLERVY